MFRIAICEDDRVFSNAHEKTCRAILDSINIDHRVSVYSNSADFVNDFEIRQHRYEMVLLDIVMDGINGMEIAQKIREQDDDTAIVFITAYDKYAIQGFSVKALHYLMKPVDARQLENLIRSVVDRGASDTWTIKNGETYTNIHIKEIICLEIAGRRIKISLKGGDVRYYPGKLTDALDELPKGQIVRCHQAYAVNANNICDFTRRGAIAANGEEIPISRTYWSSVKDAFLKKMDGNYPG